MTGKLIVAGVVILIIILLVYLFHDSGFVKTAGKNLQAVGEKVHAEKREVEITDEPLLKVKENSGKKYQVKDRKKVFYIGYGSKNDLILDDAKVEEVHAKLEKKLKNEHVYFCLTNLSKTNPTEILNKAKDKYEYLGYKESIELDDKNAIYVGDTKILIMLKYNHIPGQTERIVSGKAEEAKTVRKTAKKTAKKTETPAGSRGKYSNVQPEYERSESVRIVTRDELEF